MRTYAFDYLRNQYLLQQEVYGGRPPKIKDLVLSEELFRDLCHEITMNNSQYPSDVLTWFHSAGRVTCQVGSAGPYQIINWGFVEPEIETNVQDVDFS